MPLHDSRTDELPLRLVSLLAESAEPFYATLHRWLRSEGIEIEQDDEPSWHARRRLLHTRAPIVAALCGGLYVRERVDSPLRVLAAPVPAGPGYEGRPVYFADVIVGRHSDAQRFDDLRGGVFVFNDSESLSGHDAVLAHLRERGDVRGFFRTAIASGDHRASLDMVTSSLADVAAIDSTVLQLEIARRPSVAQEIRVLTRLGPFPSPPLVAHGVSEHLQARLTAALLAAHEAPAGREVLRLGGIERFVARTAADYDCLAELVRTAQSVRPATGTQPKLVWTLAPGLS